MMMHTSGQKKSPELYGTYTFRRGISKWAKSGKNEKSVVCESSRGETEKKSTPLT